ncbi:MAG: N-acetyltransferase [Hyphomicrobiaceae bacterium]
MADAPLRPPAFRAEHYELAPAGLWLSTITADEAPGLGAALAVIDPWVRYGTTAVNLTALFTPNTDGGIRLAIRTTRNGPPIGVAVIRSPWLGGPYMQFLALLPGAQGLGHGRAMLDWFEVEARVAGLRNIWICAAAFNDDALRLYERHGFERIAVLDNLIKPGFDEVLMRKRLNPSDS